MNILLVDLDILGKHPRRKFIFPNLALMKLSAYHKSRGDQVFLNFPLEQVDIIYTSCVFTWNRKHLVRLPAREIIVGGSGIDLKVELPQDVEHVMPDYSLYPRINFSIGFTSRGCIRKCPWCIVPKKEGGIRAVARIYEFWNREHRVVLLLDNNLLAAPNWRQTMEDLLAEDVKVDFNQGLDIRLVNEENLHYLKRLKLAQIDQLGRIKSGKLRFAFDDISYKNAVIEGVRLLTEAGINSRRLSFYALYGFEEDDAILERMEILGQLNVDVYPMAYKDESGKEPQRRKLLTETKYWHGAYHNKLKFLRLVGRLPG